MKERPILFSGPMVLAILADQKTQTRRVMREPERFGCPTGDCPHDDEAECAKAMAALSPFGVPGDRLWVRETWRSLNRFKGYKPRDIPPSMVSYAASVYDDDHRPIPDGRMTKALRPAIFMPRWASRLSLLVTWIRAERLQAISDRDARAEGAEQIGDNDGAFRAGYRDLWNAINEKRGFGWAKNPWVWVVEFKREVL